MNATVLVVTAVVLNTAAQFLLKAGAGQVSQVANSGGTAFDIGWAGATNFWVITGLACYVISFAVWIGVLAKLPVSVAYPLLSMGYVVGIFASYWLLGEPITLGKLVGISLILGGVYILSREVMA